MNKEDKTARRELAGIVALVIGLGGGSLGIEKYAPVIREEYDMKIEIENDYLSKTNIYWAERYHREGFKRD